LKTKKNGVSLLKIVLQKTGIKWNKKTGRKPVFKDEES